jgi:ABC-2 type transport system ATP-binding protein
VRTNAAASAMTFAPAVLVQQITKRYSRRRLMGFLLGRDYGPEALHEVSLSVGRGEILGLLGPNGAGKTTLLRIIAGSLDPTSGTVRVEGRIGLVTSDERSFYWRLSGRQNLEFFAALYGVPAKMAGGRIRELLELLDLSHLADRRFDTYSSGMKQRMAVARGLLADPSLILYDEPTRALDPANARAVRQWISDSRVRSPHVSHLIATNQLGEAEQLCDRVVILNRGSVIAAGSIADVRARFRESLVHRITCRGLDPTDRILPSGEWGILKVTTEYDPPLLRLRLESAKDSLALSKVLERILAQGGVIEGCQTEEVPFDEVFCSLLSEQKAPSKVEAAV